MLRNYWVLIYWVLIAMISTPACAEDWPGWRGPRGDGTSEEVGVPITWEGDSGSNIRWKTPIDGSGYSSGVLSMPTQRLSD